MADGKGEVLLAPTSGDGVHVAAADTAALDLDIDVVVAERLGLELVLVELKPRVGPVDLVAGELLWVRHLGGWSIEGGLELTREEITTREVFGRFGEEVVESNIAHGQLAALYRRGTSRPQTGRRPPRHRFSFQTHFLLITGLPNAFPGANWD